MSLFQELKRRNVFRVGIAYLITAWLVLQVSDVVLGNIVAPDWVFKTILLICALGAPVVLMFAWAFEMTPEGLKREKDVDRSQSVTHVTGRKLDHTIIFVLVLALGYFAVDKFFLERPGSKPAVQGTSRHAGADRSARSGAAAVQAGLTSIAVLPFVNMSSDKEQDYFSDGISEELLNLLAKIPAFRVAGRTSSFAFKGKNDDLRTIGESLGVSTILEGSVRKGENRVRITAQLVKVDDGFHLWSETYDRELTDVLAVQDEIAGAVVKELKVTLLGEQVPTHAPNSLTGNAEAYNAYLRGLYFWNQIGPDNRQKAAEYFEQAVALVPDSALAWAMLSLADANYASQSSDGSPAALARAREAAAKALELDDTVPEAHLAAATLDYLYNWDWDAAEVAVQRALRLRQGDVTARKMLANLRVNDGRFEEALEILQTARLQDPLDANVSGQLMDVLYYLGDLQPAEEIGLELLEKFPSRAFTHGSLGWYAMDQGRLQEALAFFEAEPVVFARLSSLAIVQHKLGNRAAAEAAQKELWERYGEAASYQQAQIYAEWGEANEAVKWLQRAYEVRDPGLPTLKIDPSFVALKQHPGYMALLKKMRLAD
ncbi:MAG: tetratricopeptide repeat protein [Gammaproteobacteria bacterium]|nr:tetratricopeptide repeat protein [Gammaproteobacteria bacterium]